MRARTFAALMVALLMAWPVAAQEQRGAIEGVVRDTSGAVLPGVTVEARAATGAVLTTVSDDTGTYRFPSVAPGDYVVTATLDRLCAGQEGRGPRRPRPDQEGRLRAVAEGRRPSRSRSSAESPLVDVRAERAADEHPRRAGRAAAEGTRLHDARDAGARRQPGSQARRPLDRRRERRREPLHHRRHRDDRPAGRHLGQERHRRLRRRSPGQVERLHRGVRRRHGWRHQRHHQERHERLARQRAVQLAGRQAAGGERGRRFAAQPARLDNIAEYITYPEDKSNRIEPGFALGGPIVAQPRVVLRRLPAGVHHQRARRNPTTASNPERRHVRRRPEADRCSTSPATSPAQFSDALRGRVAFNNSWRRPMACCRR